MSVVAATRHFKPTGIGVLAKVIGKAL